MARQAFMTFMTLTVLIFFVELSFFNSIELCWASALWLLRIAKEPRYVCYFRLSRTIMRSFHAVRPLDNQRFSCTIHSARCSRMVTLRHRDNKEHCTYLLGLGVFSSESLRFPCSLAFSDRRQSRRIAMFADRLIFRHHRQLGHTQNS